MHEPHREVCDELTKVLAAVGAQRMVIGGDLSIRHYVRYSQRTINSSVAGFIS